MEKSMGKKKNQKREPYVPMPPQKKEGKKLSTTATNVYPPLSNTPAKNLNKIMVKKMNRTRIEEINFKSHSFLFASPKKETKKSRLTEASLNF